MRVRRSLLNLPACSFGYIITPPQAAALIKALTAATVSERSPVARRAFAGAAAQFARVATDKRLAYVDVGVNLRRHARAFRCCVLA